MGLCKCPKRKTTSHFCFHHCVNVCEHCIVNNHTTCVVKSYTTWLKEASGSVSSSSISASALCAVCQKQFILTPKEIENITSNSNDSKAIRLLCYHIIHARCLSNYVKKQFKEGNIIKCPSCARPLWLQSQQDGSQDSNDTIDVDSNELSPVSLQLYKHLSVNGDWWGQALISNKNVEDIEKYLLEDEEFQKSEDESTLEIEPQINTIPDNITPLTLAQTIQSPNSNKSYFNNNSAIVHTSSDVTTINHRNSSHQLYQPTHRHFNNNYGIDSVFTQQQQQQQQQCSSVNMTIITQSSDLSNRHAVTSSTPLIINDNNLCHDEILDPSGKYRPKKFNKQSWSLNYQKQRLLQKCYGTYNRVEDNSTTKIAIIIIIFLFIIAILLLVITSYTRSNNEPFDNNSIDYGGGDDHDKNIDAVVKIKSYNINNL